MPAGRIFGIIILYFPRNIRKKDIRNILKQEIRNKLPEFSEKKYETPTYEIEKYLDFLTDIFWSLKSNTYTTLGLNSDLYFDEFEKNEYGNFHNLDDMQHSITSGMIVTMKKIFGLKEISYISNENDVTFINTDADDTVQKKKEIRDLIY